jgi:hypothetical protein
MRVVSLLLLPVLLAAGCAGKSAATPDGSPPESVPASGQPEKSAPVSPPSASAPPTEEKAAPPSAKPAAPTGANPTAPATAQPPAPATTKPAAPPATKPPAQATAKPVEPPASKPPASPTAKPAAPAAAKPPAPSTSKPAAAAPEKPAPAGQTAPRAAALPATPSATELDLDALKEELKSTKAIGVFTKLTLKNQVDDLLDRFRDHYAGNAKITMAELRRSYDMLMMKVLSLVQDRDQKLASNIVASREVIWGLLSDRKKFAALDV